MSFKEEKDKTRPKISFFQIGREQERVEAALPVATGYPILDTLLCGGLPEKFAVILTSPPCDEKDLLIRRFLITGAKDDRPTFYVAIEPNLAELLIGNYSNFYLFICNSQGEAILKNAQNAFVLKGVENLTAISIALNNAIRQLDTSQLGTGRICLNILSDILLLDGVAQTRKWLTELLTQLKSVGLTTLAVVDPEILPSEKLHAVLDLFEGEISIREADTGQGLGRLLRIKRMSNKKYLKDEVFLTEEEEEEEHRTIDSGGFRSRGFIRLS